MLPTVVLSSFLRNSYFVFLWRFVADINVKTKKDDSIQKINSYIEKTGLTKNNLEWNIILLYK